jgi:hypothetical protein
MRKALLFASAIALTLATLATRPAEAAKLSCGCWCGGAAYYNTYTCVLPNGGTVTCRTYYNNYC